jgi:hypothetical protein
MVNGFTTLYAEGRLDWLGVTKDNASDALRIFVDQFLSGHQSKLQADSKFKVFATPTAKQSLEHLKLAELAVDQILLVSK